MKTQRLNQQKQREGRLSLGERRCSQDKAEGGVTGVTKETQCLGRSSPSRVGLGGQVKEKRPLMAKDHHFAFSNARKPGLCLWQECPLMKQPECTRSHLGIMHLQQENKRSALPQTSISKYPLACPLCVRHCPLCWKCIEQFSTAASRTRQKINKACSTPGGVEQCVENKPENWMGKIRGRGGSCNV